MTSFGNVEPDLIARAKGDAIRKGFGLLGAMLRMFASAGAKSRALGDGPCPDAQPGQPEPPCEQRKRAMQERAQAYQAHRLRRRAAMAR